MGLRSHCETEEPHASLSPPPKKKTLTFGFVKCHDTQDRKMFQTKLQKGLVLIVPEHQPAAENVPLESRLTLCATWEVGRIGLLCRGRWMALSVYISTSSEAWPALRLELDTYHLTYLPLLSLTLAQRRQSPLFPVQPGSSSMPWAAFGLYCCAFTHRAWPCGGFNALKSAFKSYVWFYMVLCFLFRS